MAKFDISEFYTGYDVHEVPPKVLGQLTLLCGKCNSWGPLYPKAVSVTRGYRDEEKNMEVGGVPNSPHLTGEAVDLKDKDGKLALWFMNNIHILRELGLYMEDPRYTKGWVHLQTRPASLTIFKPY
jgi:hypothetical protein